jgi:Protein of unknown function (DUF1592)/Protein of unknown function (DUF1588)/Protein of unknown function (DUF1587)/Protein of unknown function (DUF1585)/Protein of unknown function (DUF1595)/Planctomycete cytochrome C
MMHRLSLFAVALAVGLAAVIARSQAPADDYATRVRPILVKHCLECHSTAKHKGDLDLERFTTRDLIRGDLHPWEQLLEQVEVGEMPPKGKPQPSAEERQTLLRWVRTMLGEEARKQAGDPGRVVLRRLDNAEYANTLRDLTGVDLDPAKEFPADGAAGEGFTNVGDGLAMSPTLIDRYLKAAKHVAAHAVLEPDGLRFSPFDNRRQWAEAYVAELRKFFEPYKKNGPLAPERHWQTLLEHRADLAAGKETPESLAAKTKLSPVYLRHLWDWLAAEKSSLLLDRLRARWIAADAKLVPDLVAEVHSLQQHLWSPGKRASSYGNAFEPREPKATLEISLPLQEAGDTVRLWTYPVGAGPSWLKYRNPRLEGQSTIPIDAADSIVDGIKRRHATMLADTDKYLDLIASSGGESDLSAAAEKAGLDRAVVRRWMAYLGVADPAETALPLKLLTEKQPNAKPHISGWAAASKDRLPSIVSNGSDKDETIPGFLRAHKVAMHPTPNEFVGVAWTSPIAGAVRVESAIKHTHTACGNGVVWWVERRHGNEARKLGKGALGIGAKNASTFDGIVVEKGDVILAAIGPRDHNHFCDLTEVELTIVEAGDKGRRWDLASDIADTIQAGNPHDDRLGNPGVWRFVMGPDPDLKFGAPTKSVAVPAGSSLAQWRETLGDPKKADLRTELARKIRDLTTSPATIEPDLKLRNQLTALPGPLVPTEDLARWTKEQPIPPNDARGDWPIVGQTNHNYVISPLLAPGHRFRAEIAIHPMEPTTVVAVVARSSNGGKDALISTLLVPAGSEKAIADFRRLFPPALYYPNIVPVDDDGITLRHYHREDEALSRLMLDKSQQATLDRLWTELHFVAQDAKKIHDSFDQFIGYASQVGLVPEFEPLRPGLKKAADDFAKDLLAAEPKHLAAVLDFADRAYRRPLRADEKAGLQSLYDTLRKKEVTHDEAIRTVLVRVLVSPNFLYRLENPPAKTGPVSDAELATRLSYALWASGPDAELRKDADANRLHETLAEQAERMRKSPRIRGLATEFGLQWLGVRDIAEHKEKSETLFPMFDAKLRQAMFEEAALVFEDLFKSDRPVLSLLDDDHVFVNDVLAKHYGIPGVQGPEWRRLDGAKKYGRGGVLTLASVLTKQAGASRTSPVLRGNWLVDVLLGEKLPRPPADVPQLPEAEDTSKLTVRQLVEQHTKDARCARCHVRIDPFGFSLEAYDPIGRHRTKDLAGRPIDAKASLRDGTVFDGVDGLRTYLLTKRRDDFERTFCRKLLGYSLGRAVMLSDGPLVEQMIESLHKNDGRVSATIRTIVLSPQFRNIRGQP